MQIEETWARSSHVVSRRDRWWVSNLFYDDVLRLEVPQGKVKLVGYADVLAVVITAGKSERLQELANHMMNMLNSWMRGNQIELAPEKTEVVLLACRELNWVNWVEATEVHTTKAVKYLRVVLDHNMKMTKHIEHLKENTLWISKKICWRRKRRGLQQ